MSYISLSYAEVALATSLVLVNGAVSLALGLGMGRTLAIASVRTVVQLLLVGLVLEAVFELDRAWLVGVLAVAMVLIAASAAVGRVDHRYPGIWATTVVPIWTSSWLVTAIGVGAVIRVEPWWSPQYVVPLLGMVLGNALTGISLGVDRLASGLATRRSEVEALLALGATRWEAAQGPVREAVRTGMVPILNAMAIAGVVSLPGMMTGQLLAGVPPIEAVKYQIAIMFLIASATALGTVGSVMLGYRRLFNERHQFLPDRIRGR